MVDYKGQAAAERYMLLVFVIVCTPAWVYGYLQQDFTYPFHAWLASTALAALVRIGCSCSHVSTVSSITRMVCKTDDLSRLYLLCCLRLAGRPAELGDLQPEPDQVAAERHVPEEQSQERLRGVDRHSMHDVCVQCPRGR